MFHQTGQNRKKKNLDAPRHGIHNNSQTIEAFQLGVHLHYRLLLSKETDLVSQKRTMTCIHNNSKTIEGNSST